MIELTTIKEKYIDNNLYFLIKLKKLENNEIYIVERLIEWEPSEWYYFDDKQEAIEFYNKKIKG